MQSSIKSRFFFLVLVALLLGSTAALADDCPEYLESTCGGGSAWFGLRHDGANIGQGQSVLLECNSAVASVEFSFMVTGSPNGGVESMVAGDEIHVALVDADDNLLVTATTALPANIFNAWLEFTFPPGFIVPAGQYKLLAYTNVPRQCSFAFCYNSEGYADGQRQVSVNGIDGPWSGGSSGFDVPFQLYLEPGTVANEDLTWDSLKANYR